MVAGMQTWLFLAMLPIAFASPQRCAAGQSCPAADQPRSGGAMIQTVTEKDAAIAQDNSVITGKAESKDELGARSKGMPLKARALTVETELAALTQRVAALETDVMGSSGGGAAPAAPVAPAAPAAEEPPALLGSWDDLNAGFDPSHHTKTQSAHLSLLDAKNAGKRGDDLKSKVAAAEAGVADLRSKLSTLENQVSGSSLSHPSLLEKAAGSSLKARIISLEEETDSLRSRTSTVEHIVTG